MILTPPIVVLLGTAVLTAAAAPVMAYAAVRRYRSFKTSVSAEQRDIIEDEAALLLLCGVIVSFAKLITWPLFYAALQTCIPHVPGAMCMFGVMQARPGLSTVAQVLKPAVFFFSGLWLLVHRLSAKSGSPALLGKEFLLLVPVSALVLADSVVDIAYFSSFEVSQYVACCTTVFDLPSSNPTLFSTAALGATFEGRLLPAYYGTNGALIVLLGIASKRGPYRLGVQAAVALAALCCAAVTVPTLFEFIAPKVMQLPDHHCIYCMWQYAPFSVLLTGLFLIGISSAGWGFLIPLISGRDSDSARMNSRLFIIAFVCLALSFISAVIVLLH